MAKTYKSVYVQMVYSGVTGLLLIMVPNFVMSLMGLEPTDEKIVYVLGLLAISLSFYYYQIAKEGSKKVVMGTVYGRYFFAGSVIALATIEILPLLIIPMMLFEASLAYWGWREIKNN